MNKYKTCVLAIMTVIATMILSACSKGPSAAYKEFALKANNKDWTGVYDALSVKSQDQINAQAAILNQLSAIGDAFDDETEKKAKKPKGPTIKGKDLFVKLMTEDENAQHSPFFGEVVKEKISGDDATVTIKNSSGKEQSIAMVKESQKWKVVFPNME